MTRVLIVATSRRTRGGITSVIKSHELGEQWIKFHCKWIETHRDGASLRKVLYFLRAFGLFLLCLPFYDIVHIHTADGASAKRKYIFESISKLLGKRTIVHLHLGDVRKLYEEPYKTPILKLLANADKIIVLSPQWKRDVLNVLPNVENKIIVLYNPCPKVNRNNVTRKKQILYAGTILKRKGYDVLLKAFGKIAYKHKEWKLVFAGNPYLKEGVNELEEGKRIAHSLEIDQQVEWLGWISGNKKEKVFNESSIYCLASGGEGFPMGVLDAWAYGVPCIMTPVGGIPDIVRDGEEGMLFPVGDIDALAIALDRMIIDNSLRHEIVKNTDKYVFGDFSVNSINRQLGRIYEQL